MKITKFYFIITSLIITGVNSATFKNATYRGKAPSKSINFELYNKGVVPIFCMLAQERVEVEDGIVIPAGAKLGIELQGPGEKFTIYLWYAKESLGILRNIAHKASKNIEMGKYADEGLNAYEQSVFLQADYEAILRKSITRKKIYLAFENNQLRPRKPQLAGLLNISDSGLSLSGNIKPDEIEAKR